MPSKQQINLLIPKGIRSAVFVLAVPLLINSFTLQQIFVKSWQYCMFCRSRINVGLVFSRKAGIEWFFGNIAIFCNVATQVFNWQDLGTLLTYSKLIYFYLQIEVWIYALQNIPRKWSADFLTKMWKLRIKQDRKDNKNVEDFLS